MKKPTQHERILAVLHAANGKPVSSKVFYDQKMTQCNARISELRDEGYNIESVGEDEYGYTIHILRNPPAPKPRIIDYELILEDGKPRYKAVYAT